MLNMELLANEATVEETDISEEPFYLTSGNEQRIFLAAYKRRLPLLLKGPTGCGKTRFVEAMAYKLNKALTKVTVDRAKGELTAKVNDFANRKSFLVTVPCHEDLTANDLVGRFFLTMDQGAQWIDGPLTKAVRYGGICYLDEIVEARKDVTVLLHSLSDYRRVLPLTKKGTVVTPPASFMLIVSYNPGYQSALKDLKPSTKQRFIALDFDYPEEKTEIEVVRHESGCPEGLARSLVAAGRKIRGLKTQGLTEGVSTRLIIYAATLIVEGVPKEDAVRSTLISPLTDDAHMKLSLLDICKGFDLL
ncbi:MAG: CbbQ/NirQ/NorQ/GpvN family protein [Rectinemataceae bacterium]|jgi:nitric oxide reductase NorQ protein